MSDELELKIRLKADGSGLIGEFRQGANEVKKFGAGIDEVGNSSNRGANGLREFANQGGLANSVSRSLGGNVQFLSNHLATLAGVSSLSFVGLAAAIVSVNAEFQQMRAQLVVLTGSQGAANAEFDRWKSFAAETPSQISDIVQAFIKLRNFGLRATERDMRSYSNTAAATGRSLDQFIEAVADASVLEFERLKEFGIISRQESESIAFTFRGTTTVIEKDSAAIQDYLRSIGETAFAGSVEEQMKTLSGSTSNFKDSLIDLLDTMGRVSGLDQAATNIFNRMANGARVLSDAIEETDVEKQQRLFNEMLEINFKLAGLGDNSSNNRTRTVLTAKLNRLKNEIGQVNGLVNAQIEAEAQAFVNQQKQTEAQETAEAAQKQQRLQDDLRKELQTVEKYAADREALELQALQQRLQALDAAEKSGLDSIQPYSQLRENLISDHIERVQQITAQKQQEIENQKRQAYLEELRAERERYRAISDIRYAELAKAQGYLDQDFDMRNAHYARSEAAERIHQDRLRATRLNAVGDYAAITQKFVDFDRTSGLERVGVALDIATQISGAAARESKKAFNLHKALSIAQATVSAALSIVQVLGDSTIPSTTAKMALAGTIGTLAAFQIGLIAKQKFQGGRMFGGNVSAGNFVEVGEQNRPELFKQDGKLLLFPGNRGGEVIPLGGQGRRVSGATSSVAGTQLVVNLINAPERPEIRQSGNQIDVIWPEFQRRLGTDLRQGASWTQLGESTYGWSRSNGARAAR